MTSLRKPGTPPEGSKYLIEAWGILQRKDKSPSAHKRLLELAQLCPQDEHHKFGAILEAFIAYGGVRQ